MFEVDPKLKVDMIKRQKMKQVLKTIKRQRFKNSIHPSLKDEIENEKRLILEAVLVKEQPNVQLVAPQSTRENEGSKNISYPLQNFLKDKRIKDLTSK